MRQRSGFLLIEVEQKGLKSNVHNKLVSSSEAADYVNMDAVIAFGEKEPGQKNKWIALLLCSASTVFTKVKSVRVFCIY